MSPRSGRDAIDDAKERRSLEQRRQDRGSAVGDGDEQPQPPGDDLAGQPQRLELIDGAVGEAGQFDAGGAHHRRAPDGEPAGEMQDGAIGAYGGPRFVRRQGRRVIQPERPADLALGSGRNQAADGPLAVVGLQAIDAQRFIGQPVPDRQQQAGDEVVSGVVVDFWAL